MKSLLMLLLICMVSGCVEEYKLYDAVIEGEVLEFVEEGVVVRLAEGQGDAVREFISNSVVVLSFVLYDERGYDGNPRDFVIGQRYVFYVKRTKGEGLVLSVVMAESERHKPTKAR